MKGLFITIIFLFLFINNSHSQTAKVTDLYQQAMTVIAKGDTLNAEKLLLNSVADFEDAPSYFKLAAIYQVKNTVSDLNIAREYIKKALQKDDNSIIYHLVYASILERLYLMSEFEFDARSRAENEYTKILEIDSTYSFAWYKLGMFKRDDYIEFSESYLRVGDENTNKEYTFFDQEEFGQASPTVKGSPTGFKNDPTMTRKMTQNETRDMAQMNALLDQDSPLLSYEGVVEEDFLDAEYYLLKAIETNPKNYKARLELGFLYEDADVPEMGVPVFRELVEENPLDKDAHLFLGLLYYEVGDLDSSNESFQNALSLMQRSEFNDYTYYSVLMLLEPILGERASNFTMGELKIFIDAFWKVRDPYNLTKYNERLLEHYARVAYSNFRFTPSHKNVSGWQTDMGEMMVRYGNPPSRKRFRQGVTLNDFSMYQHDAMNYDYLAGSNIKTEVWYYNDIAIAFTDEYSSGDYKYHDPFAQSRRSFAQATGDSRMTRNNLVNSKPEIYVPKLKGNVVNLPYNAVQFRGENKSTDVFINYALSYDQKFVRGNGYFENHDVGLFFFDKYFHPIIERRNSVDKLDLRNKVSLNDSTKYIINALSMNLKPQTGNCSFEYKSQNDNGVASYQGKYKIRNYGVDTLTISDVLVSTSIDPSGQMQYPIKRKEFSILPNPGHSFSKSTDLFLYFEVYNLQRNNNGLTDFAQTIEVEKFKEEKAVDLVGIIGSFFEFIGLTGDSKIELTSNYQTVENDPQIYMQLDLSDYDPGKYLIKVKIKDNYTQKEIIAQSLIVWQQ